MPPVCYHLPRVPLPKTLRSLEFMGIMLHRAILKKYSLCFIPDLPGELNVSGRLSHGFNLPDNVRYIGILSRFISDKPSLHEYGAKHKYNTVILSERGWFSSVKQNELKAGIQIPLKEYICSDEIIKQSLIYLKKALKELLEEPHI